MMDLTYAEFFRAHWLHTVRFILHKYPGLGWHDAEDVAQQALLRAWETWDAHDPAKATRATWLVEIALWYGLTAFNYYKRRAEHGNKFVGVEPAMEPDPYEGVARRELLEKCVGGIEQTGGDTLLELYDCLIGGATVREAAQAQDISYVSATGRLQYIREKLRRDVDPTPTVV